MSLFGKEEKIRIARLEADLFDCKEKNAALFAENERLVLKIKAKDEALAETTKYFFDLMALHRKLFRDLTEEKQRVIGLRAVIEARDSEIEDLKKELERAGEQVEELTDVCADSMDTGWQPVPEEDMLAGGFEKTADGYVIPKDEEKDDET